MKKEDLLEYLARHCQGRGQAMSSQELERKLRISENELRRQVNRLRQEGKPIASGRNGYFYARTAGEIYGTIQILKKMRAGLDRVIAGLERALDSFSRGGDSYR